MVPSFEQKNSSGGSEKPSVENATGTAEKVNHEHALSENEDALSNKADA